MKLEDGEVDDTARIVVRTFAYAAGLTESDVAESTTMSELGIDSVAIAAVGVILEAEFGIRLAEAALIKMLEAETVAQNVAMVRNEIEIVKDPTT